MSAIQNWSIVICLAALIAALFQSLTPDGAMERMMKFVIGAFIIAALITPLTSTIPQLSLDLLEGQEALQENNTEFSSKVDQQLMDASQASITNLVTAELGRINIKCKNVSVDMDTNEDGSIVINQIHVKIISGNCGKAQQHLQEVLGLKTEVTSDGSE